MTEVLVEFDKGDTRKCRGRNIFNADAIGVEVKEDENTLYIFGRVASNQKTNTGWVAMPNDPVLIQQLIEALQGALAGDHAPAPQKDEIPEDKLKAALEQEWRTGAGKVVKLGDIGDDHLLNLLRHVKKRLDAVRQADDDALSMWCDDKIQIGFTGNEGAIEYFETVLRNAKIVLQHRLAKDITVNDPADTEEIPFA